MRHFIQLGGLDILLIRPRNELFQILIRELWISDIGDLFGAVIKILFALSLLNMHLDFIQIALFLFLMVCGVLIIFSIILVVSALSFFVFGFHRLIYAMFDLIETMKYPIDIYGGPLIFIFTFVLPFAFATYYPTEFIIGKGINRELIWLSPIVAATSFTIAYTIWKEGIKRYSSSGS